MSALWARHRTILSKGCGAAVIVVVSTLFGHASLAASLKLPATAPVPTQSPATPPNTRTADPESAPVPAPRPELPPYQDVKPKAVEPPPVRRETFGPPAPTQGGRSQVRQCRMAVEIPAGAARDLRPTGAAQGGRAPSPTVTILTTSKQKARRKTKNYAAKISVRSAPNSANTPPCPIWRSVAWWPTR